MEMAQCATIVLFLFVAVGMTPMWPAFIQFLIVGLHVFRSKYKPRFDYTPRVAFILPAWNESDVIGSSIDSLMSISYPDGAWRIYVVDDASTDSTPEIMREKTMQYPGFVFHLRREVGGRGKAHTLNHGLGVVLDDDWAEVVMIMDADVLFEKNALRKMVLHLANPDIGAVTAYVKEGSQPGTIITRSIAFEYITAQAAARRAQNVVGVLACLAGGAQLHSRANLMELGGKIDTSTLAEDSYTTFRTQLNGRQVVFEGNALVWAEEPDSIVALWKQRLRWARGNLQITSRFRDVWFRPRRHAGLGSIPFGVLWFSILLTPVFMIMTTIGLLGLEIQSPAWAWTLFATQRRLALVIFVFETVFTLLIDPATAQRAWLEGLTFPGLISLGLTAVFFVPVHTAPFFDHLLYDRTTRWSTYDALKQFMYGWVSLSMLAAWGLFRLERAGVPRWLRNGLLVLVGYGPLLCAISFTALATAWRKSDMHWDKTVKSGKARILK
jgi:cellulose synthase/poly-beta-1,6-N-acetylglucosamine synthase-like glycosyltransferase